MTAPAVPAVPGSLPCRLAQAKQRDAAIKIVRRAYAERIVESGVKRAWDKREALEMTTHAGEDPK